MQFNINGNSITINAKTKEELETVRKELQYALDHVKGQLRTAARADHLSFDDATDVFFGVKFDFENMTEEERASKKNVAEHLFESLSEHHRALPCYINQHPQFFFGAKFDFAVMSDSEFLNAKEECKRLLDRLNNSTKV